ncbi:MAG: hypothetical protein WCA00_03515 [Candidatus Acidiferrales bacterium]
MKLLAVAKLDVHAGVQVLVNKIIIEDSYLRELAIPIAVCEDRWRYAASTIHYDVGRAIRSES